MMKSFQLSYFQLLCLLTAALLECKAETERPCKQVYQLNIRHLHGDSMSISCQTTPHPLESLTVKLRSIIPLKDILNYPDTSSASEHQRWSVRNDAGNVTFDLKDIRSSDGGLYDCQVYKDQDCLHSTRFNLSVIMCETLNSVHATLNSSVLLPCSEHPLQNRTEQVTWKVVSGHQLTDVNQYRAPYKPSSSTEKPPDPLYERARQLKNGSLLIRNAVHTDELWYRCRVNGKTCYEIKLVMKAETERPCKQVYQLNISHLHGDSMSISCQTTTHPLESLTVKLRSIIPLKDILNYPDTSSASEHQRWSVRNDAGNVIFDLKDIRSSDGGFYDCQVYKDQDCLHTTRFNLSIIMCKTLNSVHATLNSSVLLPCSEHPLHNRTEQVTWKVVSGHQSTDINQYRAPYKPSSSTEKPPDPLYERARQLKNGSLLVRNAGHTDELLYRCRVNEKTCYEIKLVIKDDKTFYSTILETLSTTLLSTTDAPTPAADNTAGQTEGNNHEESETVTANLTVVVMTTVVSLCVLISLTICVILYFKKRRRKTNSQTELNCWSTIYYSNISGGVNGLFYSLDEHNT
ncbi:uncharacterized protein LOC109089169 isoform X2 [Cyprinus carpio]|uniref:Uncharacterized protein LOC109089169 isoform X2 n=1 Tax=Cyprinus carpio TaxID=7962 RepID=A0A9R0BB94_CYPCA|nr:uncharacterized protein LOC109089169 isoform X2 [Cyprinus carpio]